MHFDIDDLAQPAAGHGIAQCDHHWGEAQLEIHGGQQLALPADLQNPGRIGEIHAHRLLDQGRRTFGQHRQDVCMGGGRGRQIENRAIHRRRFLDRPKGTMPKGRRLLVVGIVDAGNLIAALGIGRQMGVAHDGTRAKDHDGPAHCRGGPVLA